MTRARIDEEAEENIIMGLDLSDMDDMRRSYFDRKMTRIMERQAQRRTATVLDEAAARVAEAQAAATAIASLVARNLDDTFVNVEEVAQTVVQVVDASLEDGTPEKETDFSGSDDMLAFAAMCEKLAGQAEFQTEIAANGVWPEVADVAETVVTATPMPTVM